MVSFEYSVDYKQLRLLDLISAIYCNVRE